MSIKRGLVSEPNTRAAARSWLGLHHGRLYDVVMCRKRRKCPIGLGYTLDARNSVTTNRVVYWNGPFFHEVYWRHASDFKLVRYSEVYLARKIGKYYSDYSARRMEAEL